MDNVQFNEGDQVRIKPDAADIPEGWLGRSGTVIEVESEPANPTIGLQARIQFPSGGVEPVVPVSSLEPA